MKKLLLSLIAVPFFVATAQQLQVKNITVKCPNPAPGQEWKPTLQLTVEGGMAPYTFSSANPSVSPMVSGETATFSFVLPAEFDSTTNFTITDSSSIQQTASFKVNFAAPQGFDEWVVFDFTSPTPGSANGIIEINVYHMALQTLIFDCFLNNVGFFNQPWIMGWGNLKAGAYKIEADGRNDDNTVPFYIGIQDFQLNELANS
jgi:hypothetical protein